jgi:hypothetical protein
MEEQDKPLLQLIMRVRDKLVAGQAAPLNLLRSELAHAMSHMNRLQTLQRRLDLCAKHGLLLAAHRVFAEVPLLVADIEYAFQAVHRAVQTQYPPVPTPRDLVLELQQLKQEFGEYQYDADDQALSVETEPIELEGIALGAFRIELHLNHLGTKAQQSALRIVALDPNPPAGNDSVTHPHVSDENLCAGDATAALQAAMASGRIADVFMLVKSVLSTYNPHSPYVALDNWHGTPCAECGYTIVDDDERYTCQICDGDFCSECTTSCNHCDDTICVSCAVRCPQCDHSFCKGCLETCEQCDRELCHGCKVDGLCPDCLEKKEKRDEEQEQPQDAPEVAEAGTIGA